MSAAFGISGTIAEEGRSMRISKRRGVSDTSPAFRRMQVAHLRQLTE